MAELTLSEAAHRAWVSPATLRRWGEQGVVPDTGSGSWTPAAAAYARIVARLRARGHTLDQIKAAAGNGRLAFGYVEDLFPPRTGGTTVEDAAARTGLDPALVERLFTAIGFSAQQLDSLSPEDVQLLDYGREVNLAARVAARAAGGEVLVTRPVVERAGSHLEFEPIGEVRLKGFSQSTELFLARLGDD